MGMPGIADLMGAITGGAPTGGAPTGGAPTGVDSIPENSEETGSVENDFLTGIANALSGESPAEESSPQDDTAGGSPLGDIANMPDLSNNQNDLSGGMQAAVQMTFCQD